MIGTLTFGQRLAAAFGLAVVIFLVITAVSYRSIERLVENAALDRKSVV